jgi:uncharacterized protein (DUF2141 family)
MNKPAFYFYAILFMLILWSGCANIIPPSGGKIDGKPPKLLSIKPQDSLLNTRVTRIDLKFDEFVTVNDLAKELNISPILSINPSMISSGKSVTLKIPDSLLQSNTTYTISFGKSIRDLHEGNPYSRKNFVFSTGAWFDTLKLKGTIIDAASGKLDSSGGIKILLYPAKEEFDVILKKKPSYLTTSENDGSFHFTGLPSGLFRIFALKDNNESLKFDGDEELIGFLDTVFNPAIDTMSINLSIFKEIPDSSKLNSDTAKVIVKNNERQNVKKRLDTKQKNLNAPKLDNKTFNYSLKVDTTDIGKRTQDITEPISLFFSRKLDRFEPQKILLSVDSNGIEIETKTDISLDTSKMELKIAPIWTNNSVYILRLLKGFATDTVRETTMPSKYIFRSKSFEDYGQLSINTPKKYLNKNFLLEVKRDQESFYLESIEKNKIVLKNLVPGSYTIQIIEDNNGDGKWTTGELKKKQHAELIIPYPSAVNMKAGWEHVIDFEQTKNK